MTIFKKYVCSECFKKVSSIAKRFSNNKILCKDCAAILSIDGLNTNISYEIYQEIREYQSANFTAQCKKFQETHSYKNIHMDAKNHLFYIGNHIDENTIFLTFRNIKRCDFDYSVPTGAKPFLGSVNCKVSISITARKPNISYQYTVSDTTKVTLEDIDGFIYHEVEKYSCEAPETLKTFLKQFYDACERTGTRMRNESNDSAIDAFRAELEKDPIMRACNFSDEELREIKAEREQQEQEDSQWYEQKWNEAIEEKSLFNSVDEHVSPNESEISKEEFGNILQYLHSKE